MLFRLASMVLPVVYILVIIQGVMASEHETTSVEFWAATWFFLTLQYLLLATVGSVAYRELRSLSE